MKKLLLFVTALFAVLFCHPTPAYSQAHIQPCHGQDTSHLYRTKTYAPIAIAVSNGQKVAVAGHNWSHYGATATLKIWNNLNRMMMGLNANDSLHLTEPEGLVYDNAGNLYVVQTERTDSNILIYNSTLHLIKVINNSPGTAVSWFNPRGISIDSAQNIYVISGDSIGAGGTEVPYTGKLIKISSPLSTAAKSVLLTHLNAPKAVVIKATDLYVSEYAENKVSRYSLPTMTKVDSATINKPMDLFSTGCKLYCTEHDSNAIKIFDAQNLVGGFTNHFKRLDTNRGPFGIALNNDQDLLVCDSNRVLFYSDSETVSDTDYIATFSGGGGGGWPVYINCLNHNFIVADSVRHGIWHTNDSTSISIATDALYDSVVHVFGDSVGIFLVTNTHGATTDSFYVTITSADIWRHGIISDSARGGAWFTHDSTLLALVATGYDSSIRFYGYHTGSGEVYYRHGSRIDTFHVYIDTTLVAGPIYTYDNSGVVYGSYRFCIGNIAQLFNDTYTPSSYWSISDTSIAFIDEADGIVWPKRPGSATVTYTVISYCGTTIATFGITIDSDATAGIITGPSFVCEGADIVLKDTVLGGTWQSVVPGVAAITGVSGDSITLHGSREGTTMIKYHINNTCADTLYKDIEVKRRPHVTGITGSSVVCYATATTLIANGGTTGYWRSGNTSVVAVTGHDTVCSAYGAHVGSAAVTYSDTNSCGRDSVTTVINVIPPPYPATISGPTSLCSGDAYTFTASVGGGSWSSSSALATVDASGSGTVAYSGVSPFGSGATITYTLTNPCGATFSTYSITLYGPPIVATISPSTDTICTGVSLSFSSSVVVGTGGSQSWSLSNSNAVLTGSSSSSATILGVSAGVVTLTHTATNGCGSTTRTATIVVNPAAIAGHITGPSTVCVSSVPYYRVGGSSDPYGGTWSSGSRLGFYSQSYDTAWFFALSSGVSNVCYTVTNACGTDITCDTVTVIRLPNAGPDDTSLHATCSGVALVLVAPSSGSGTIWASGNSAIARVGPSGYATDSVYRVGAGSVTIYNIDSNFCGSDTATFRVAFNPLPNAGSISGPSNACIGTPITLTNTVTGGTWRASNSRATVSSSGVVAGITSGIDTIYYTSATVCGRDSVMHIVTVFPVPHVSAIAGSGTLCFGSPVTLTDSVSGGTWSATNGHATVSSTGVVTAVSPGVDTIVYSVTNYCGTATAMRIITVVPVPDAGTIIGPSNICDGTTEVYTILGGTDSTGGTWTCAGSIVYSVQYFDTMEASSIISGAGTICYNMRNACGVDTTCYSITVHPLPYALMILGPFTVCLGSAITLSDSTSGGVWAASNSHGTISATGLVTGMSPGLDTFYYSVTNFCGTDTASHIVTINNTTIVSDSIAVTRDTVCAGDTVTFTVYPTNGGSSPFYQWQKFGVDIDTGLTFTYVPTLSDVITCKMSSSVICPVPAVATSNSITMLVIPSVTPTVSIIASPVDTITYYGQLVTFYATVTYGGTATTYQWYSHGVAITGATSSSYNTSVYSNDTVYCVITSNVPCATSSVATSNNIVIYADYLGVHDIKTISGTFSIFPNPNTASFTLNGSGLGNEALDFEVRDVAARVVYRGVVHPVNGVINQPVNMNNALPSGNYFIRLISAGGAVVLPFVKE